MPIGLPSNYNSFCYLWELVCGDIDDDVVDKQPCVRVAIFARPSIPKNTVDSAYATINKMAGKKQGCVTAASGREVYKCRITANAITPLDRRSVRSRDFPNLNLIDSTHH